jgi:hypothetical protein
VQHEGLTGEQTVSDTDLVFVAAHPRVKDGRKDVAFEVRMLESGRPAGIAFTSIRFLVEALGQSQPWVAMPLGRFRQLIGAAGVGEVAVNPSVPEDAVLWRAEDVDELTARGQA